MTSRPCSNALLLWAFLTVVGCGDSTDGSQGLEVSVSSQDRVVSENGELVLRSGMLSVRAISLVGPDGQVPWLRAVTVDLAAPTQELSVGSPVPAGSYTGLAIELGPADEDGHTLDATLETPDGSATVRVTSELVMTGIGQFPEGARSIDESTELSLRIGLTQMFFYLYPVTDAVDGHYEAGESERDFLTMNLIAMFDLVASP